MRTSMSSPACLLLALLVALARHDAMAQSAAAARPAQPSADSAPFMVVQVTGLRARPWKSYRAMRAALAAFEQYRFLAPDAVFSFAALPPVGTRLAPTIKLRVLSEDGREFPIALENGELFQLPLLPDPKTNADLVSNLAGGQLRIGLLVHTRGVPPEKERLGDVRLRARIHQAIEEVDNPPDHPGCRHQHRWSHCRQASVTVWHTPRAPASGAWIVEGGRREALESNHDPRAPAYRIPLAGGHWGNDALIEFGYTAPLPPLSLSEVAIYNASN